MSEQLRHKIITYEATPPPAAWDAIVARLNDDIQYAALAIKMNGFDANPSPVVWDTVASRLNDDSQYIAMATKLNNFETMPPAGLWTTIALALQEQKKPAAPVINIRKTLYRVVAAAVITGFFVGGWMLLNNKKNEKTVVAGSITDAMPIRSAIKQKKHAVGGKNDASGTNEAVIVLHDKPGQNYMQTYRALPPGGPDDNDGPVLKHAVVHNPLAYQERPIVILSSPILDKEGSLIRNLDLLTNSNYINTTGPNGESTRISAKFANVIGLLNGSSNNREQYLEGVMEEKAWKKRLQEWRTRISRSAYIPSPGNFLDIIEFKELIREKQ